MAYKMIQQEFDTYLEAEVAKLTPGQILSYGDVHQALAEHLNNSVIEAWERDNPLPSLDDQLEACVSQWAELIRSLIPLIDDDMRATDDPGDDTPGMCVTIGFTPETRDRDFSWGYQTGDNSFSGGAYSHPHWAVIYLSRDSDANTLAEEASSQIADLVP